MLRDYLNQQWSNELLDLPPSRPRRARAGSESVGPDRSRRGACRRSCPRWSTGRGTQSVKSAKLSFVASLAPLAADTYTLRYGDQPVAAPPVATDLKVVAGPDQVRDRPPASSARGSCWESGSTMPRWPPPRRPVPWWPCAWRTAPGLAAAGCSGRGSLSAYSAKLTEKGPVLGARGRPLHLRERQHSRPDHAGRGGRQHHPDGDPRGEGPAEGRLPPRPEPRSALLHLRGPGRGDARTAPPSPRMAPRATPPSGPRSRCRTTPPRRGSRPDWSRGSRRGRTGLAPSRSGRSG